MEGVVNFDGHVRTSAKAREAGAQTVAPGAKARKAGARR